MGTSGNEFGQRLRDLRNARDWTIATLAQKTGVSQVSIWNLENGRNLPKYDTLTKLAAALDVEVGELFQVGAA